jgi:hypothetical protein
MLGHFLQPAATFTPRLSIFSVAAVCKCNRTVRHPAAEYDRSLMMITLRVALPVTSHRHSMPCSCFLPMVLFKIYACTALDSLSANVLLHECIHCTHVKLWRTRTPIGHSKHPYRLSAGARSD